MKRSIPKLRNLRIQTKLIISFSLLITLQTVLQSVMYFQIAMRQIVSSSVQSSADAVDKNNALADMALNAVLNSIKSYNVDPDLIRLQGSVALGGEERDIRELERRLFDRYFWDISEKIRAVYLLSPQQDSVFFGTRSTFEEFQLIFPDYREFGTDFIWKPTHVALKNNPTGEEVFSIVRHLTPAAAYQGTIQVMDESFPSPYIVVNIKPEVIYHYHDTSLPTPGSRYLIATREGQWVHGSNPERRPEDNSLLTAPWFADALEGNGAGLYHTRYGDLLVSYVTSEVNGWISAMIVPVDELTDGVSSYGKWVLLLNNTISLLVMAALYFLSIHFMRPVHELAGFASRISTGCLEAPAKRHAGGEVGVISDTIHLMNDWLKNLMEKNSAISLREQEATIAALEMQLNPHFLFNTLNSINLLAIKNGQQEISGTIVNLSGMLHYTLDQQNRFVQLDGELQFLEKYLYLMQARYTNHFEVHYDIDQAARSYIVPKMILQICVENAILHGIRDNPAQGKITVRARVEGARLILQVEDNGKGIPREKVKTILSGRSRGKNHIGFANVDKRLKLLFGEEYGIAFPSLHDPTIVEISVPVIENIQYPPTSDDTVQQRERT